MSNTRNLNLNFQSSNTNREVIVQYQLERKINFKDPKSAYEKVGEPRQSYSLVIHDFEKAVTKTGNAKFYRVRKMFVEVSSTISYKTLKSEIVARGTN